MAPSSKPVRERLVTISNALSLSRALLTIPLIWALETDRLNLALGIIVAAVISDFLDGYLARRAHQITDVGKLLAPIADKFILLGVMVFLIMDPERRFPLFFFVVLGVRDIAISNIALYLMDRRQEVFETNLPGKWFVFISAVAMTLYVLKLLTLGFWVLMVATALMLTSGYLYIRRYARYFKTLPAN